MFLLQLLLLPSAATVLVFADAKIVSLRLLLLLLLLLVCLLVLLMLLLRYLIISFYPHKILPPLGPFVPEVDVVSVDSVVYDEGENEEGTAEADDDDDEADRAQGQGRLLAATEVHGGCEWQGRYDAQRPGGG